MLGECVNHYTRDGKLILDRGAHTSHFDLIGVFINWISFKTYENTVKGSKSMHLFLKMSRRWLILSLTPLHYTTERNTQVYPGVVVNTFG